MRLAIAVALLSVQAFGAINVSSVATAGDGTPEHPWKGWDTALTWIGNQQYNFPSGVYAYDTSPNFLKSGLALVGEGGTILKHTGAGSAVVFDNSTLWTFNVRMENFVVVGNPATINGLFLRGVRNSTFRNISVRDVAGAGLESQACVTNVLDNFRVSTLEVPFTIVPEYGIFSHARSTNSADGSTTWTIINPVIEGVKRVAILLGTGYGNVINGGTCEHNLGKGLVLDSTLNTITGTSFENNSGGDIEINHYRNTLQNVFSDGKVTINPSQSNRLSGGVYRDITIHPYADFTVLEGVRYTGTLSDGSIDSIKIGNQGASGGGPGGLHFESYLGQIIERIQQLDSGPVMNTNANRNSKFWFVCFENFLLANPTNGIEGQSITWRIQQSNAGGHQISFGSKFRAKGGVFPTLNPAPLSFTYITAIYNKAPQMPDTWDIQ